MAGLQRFITYIYKYDNDEKMENTGFAKFEIRGNICKIEAHIRNISMEQFIYLQEKRKLCREFRLGQWLFRGDARTLGMRLT